eukprot:scaffold8113_cov67-Phaeocystis_antarctica.AAC.7
MRESPYRAARCPRCALHVRCVLPMPPTTTLTPGERHRLLSAARVQQGGERCSTTPCLSAHAQHADPGQGEPQR